MIEFKRKLCSRKLWAAVVGVIVGLAAAFGIAENDYAQIVGIITSAVSVVGYIAGEAQIDAADAEARGRIEAASAPLRLEFPDETKIADDCGNGGESAETDGANDGSS